VTCDVAVLTAHGSCGSALRTQAPAATARFEMPAPTVIIAKLTDASYDLQWLRLSEGGAWMVRVYDSTGDFVDGSIADDPAEALLAVAERLLP
jgi:hypothetical protein